MDTEDYTRWVALNQFSRAMGVGTNAVEASVALAMARQGLVWLRANPDLAALLLKQDQTVNEWAVRGKHIAGYKKAADRESAFDLAEQLSAQAKVSYGVFWRPKLPQPQWTLDSWVVPPGRA